MDFRFVKISIFILALGQGFGWGLGHFLAERRADYLKRAVTTEATLVNIRQVERTTKKCRNTSSRNRRNCTTETRVAFQHILDVRVNGRNVRASMTESSPMPLKEGESFEVLADPENPTDVRHASYADEDPNREWPMWAGLIVSVIGILMAVAGRGRVQDIAPTPAPVQPQALPMRSAPPRVRMPWDKKAG